MPNPLLQNENQELLYVEVYSQYSAGSGIDITSGVISLDPYISASIDSKLASADFGTYSANVAQDIAYVSANAGKTYSGISPIVVNDTTISADNFDLIIGSGLAFENNTLYVSAEQGKTYNGISPIYVNNTTNEISADSQDITFGSGLDFTSGVLSVTAQGGDPEVESVVKTYSGDWGTITALSSTSALLSGAIDNKLDTSSIEFNNDNTYVTGISGKEISASKSYKSYSSTYAFLADNANNSLSSQTAIFDEKGNRLSATYSSLYDLSSFVNLNSGAWNDGKTYTGIAPIVVNNTTNEISADSFDLTIGSGLAFENDTLYVSAQGGNPEVEQVVQTYSAAGTWLINSDLSGYLTTAQYETDSAVFNAKQDALTFTTANTVSTATNYGYFPNTGISGVNGSAFVIPMKTISYFDPKFGQTYSAINRIYRARIAAELDGQGNYIKDTYQKVSGVSATEWNSNYETVNTNSANWEDATTAYQTNSASYLTAHQAISAEEWNSNYDTVTTNSGAWGGQSLPISAGSGVNITLVDNTLVFSNDETVLFSGMRTTGTITLSEPADNFNRVKILYCINDGISNSCDVIPESTGVKVGMVTFGYYASYCREKGIVYTLSGNKLTPDVSAAVYRGGNNSGVTASTEAPGDAFRVNAVIGIGRKV